MKFGLLGEKLGHSFSPLIHSKLAGYDYGLVEVPRHELSEFFALTDLNGFNVTIPYKEHALMACDEVSEIAAEIGCVNTVVVRENGKFYGDNTDFYGLDYLLERSGIDCAKGKVLVLGSGGSSLTAQAVLRSRGCKDVVVVSRRGENNYGNLYLHYDAAYIINTTPVGMYPGNGESPIADFSPLTPREVGFSLLCGVVDLIYNPAKTELMMQAEALGIPAFNGLPMLVAQAKRAAEIFTGKQLEDDEIERICELITKQTRNIVLIGMPGCGKTTIGKVLAEKTGRELIDVDRLVEAKAGKSIPEIFAESGEAVFREMETEALREVCKQSGKIVATGGGVVTQVCNRDVMRQNGILVYLDREVGELDTKGRPISLSVDIRELANRRLPIYKEWADLTVPVQSVEETVEMVMERLS